MFKFYTHNVELFFQLSTKLIDLISFQCQTHWFYHLFYFKTVNVPSEKWGIWKTKRDPKKPKNIYFLFCFRLAVMRCSHLSSTAVAAQKPARRNWECGSNHTKCPPGTLLTSSNEKLHADLLSLKNWPFKVIRLNFWSINTIKWSI